MDRKTKQRAYDRIRSDNAKAKKLCRQCKKVKSYKKCTRCRTCYFKFVASKYLGSADRWRELESALLQSGHRCAYTGRKIDLGEGASIEHVLPTSRGKKREVNDLKNIKWVHRDINVMKGAHTVAEFIAICKQILDNFGYEVRRDD